MDRDRPSDRMRALGIVQRDDPLLGRVARPFALPAEADAAEAVVARLLAALARLAEVHDFAKGMGLAAPQLGLERSCAVVRPPGGSDIVLLNPRVTDASTETDEQYEGCLSFFDVRGLVSRPHTVDVEHTSLDGTVRHSRFTHGTARLVCHEVDHLLGVLYPERMAPGAVPISLDRYRGIGQRWTYPPEH